MRNWILTVITVLAVANFARCEEPSYKLQVKVYECVCEKVGSKIQTTLILNAEQNVRSESEVKYKFDEEIDEITKEIREKGFICSLQLGQSPNGKVVVNYKPKIISHTPSNVFGGGKPITSEMGGEFTTIVSFDQLTKLYIEGNEMITKQGANSPMRWWRVAVKVSKSDEK
jgi:hypothetical protein